MFGNWTYRHSVYNQVLREYSIKHLYNEFDQLGMAIISDTLSTRNALALVGAASTLPSDDEQDSGVSQARILQITYFQDLTRHWIGDLAVNMDDAWWAWELTAQSIEARTFSLPTIYTSE